MATINLFFSYTVWLFQELYKCKHLAFFTQHLSLEIDPDFVHIKFIFLIAQQYSMICLTKHLLFKGQLDFSPVFCCHIKAAMNFYEGTGYLCMNINFHFSVVNDQEYNFCILWCLHVLCGCVLFSFFVFKYAHLFFRICSFYIPPALYFIFLLIISNVWCCHYFIIFYTFW